MALAAAAIIVIIFAGAVWFLVVRPNWAGKWQSVNRIPKLRESWMLLHFEYGLLDPIEETQIGDNRYSMLCRQGRTRIVIEYTKGQIVPYSEEQVRNGRGSAIYMFLDDKARLNLASAEEISRMQSLVSNLSKSLEEARSELAQERAQREEEIETAVRRANDLRENKGYMGGKHDTKHT